MGVTWVRRFSVMLILGLMTAAAYAVDLTDDDAGLVRGNVQSTDYSALVKIERITRSGPPSGYATWFYEATVLEGWYGPKLDQISFRQTVEADMSVRVPKKPQIVSLCRSQERGYYIPDNGFMLPATKHLEAVARQTGKMRRHQPVTRKGKSDTSWCQ